MKKYLQVAFLIAVIFLGACVEPSFQLKNSTPYLELFDFNTTKNIQWLVSMTDGNGNPMGGHMIELYNNKYELISKSITNELGQVGRDLVLPSNTDGAYLRIVQVGIPEWFWLGNKGGKLSFNYSGSLEEVHAVLDIQEEDINLTNSSRRTESVNIAYMGTYNNKGVPDYLENDKDIISTSLLVLIDASLPEYQPVPQYHPSYLADGKTTSLEIIDQADVWLTFVHEGAGWRNAMAYYTYDTDNPPSTPADIGQLNIVFPNLSFVGSGGGLQSGDKVYLGSFNDGTSIGLAVLADGWDGVNSEDYYHITYSDKQLNPETDDELKQHNVLLYDEGNSLFVVGFEDVRRDNIPFTCDQDFNDAIVYFSANPITSINTQNVNPIDQPIDADGDGVSDVYDEFPDNPLLAYKTYYPSETTYGTFAFEDNWPDLGDYDFNDLVMDYRFSHTSNSQNLIVNIEATFVIKALGAGYRNGFGFSIDNISPSNIQSVTGSYLNSGYSQISDNGTEANQSNAVFIVTENLHEHFNEYGFVNTNPDKTYHDPFQIDLNITLAYPQSYQSIGTAPYNPFLIVGGIRGREVHLPSYVPTDLADPMYFGSGEDNTDLSQGIYYKSNTSLPWGINLPVSFRYPNENTDIRQVHLMFNPWVESSGFSYMDWYGDHTGYRNTNKLYPK